MLTIYLIGFAVILVGGLVCLREGLDEVSAGDVAAMLGISVLWFIMLPIAGFIWLLDKFGKLLIKDKK